MTNPFDAAIPAMIECYESNVAYYRSGAAKPNYPMPAIPTKIVYSIGRNWLSICNPVTHKIIRFWDIHGALSI